MGQEDVYGNGLNHENYSGSLSALISIIIFELKEYVRNMYV